MPIAPDIARGRRLALTGMLANLGLAAVKLVAGLLGGSHALVADAVESMVDLAGSAVIWGGLHIAGKPADENHPYGHGRAETIAAMLVAMMVFVAGLGIAVRAAGELFNPSAPPKLFTLWVLIAVIVVKEVLFRVVRRGARQTGSGAVHVDAWHHRADAITSLAALVGIAASALGGIRWGDAAAALVASGIIMANGVLLFRRPVHELMDAGSPDIVEQAAAVAESTPGVLNTHKVTARKSGLHYFVDMHVRVSPEMTVRESHALGHSVKDAIRRRNPRIADVLIHIEPWGHEP